MKPILRCGPADELIAHFVDGLRAGSSPGALADAFGPARQAARLIRRAKRRNRPLLCKAWARSVQAVGLLIGLVVVIYIVAAIRLFTGKPVLAHDYLADLNAKARAVPQTQRAWPMYRTALVALGEIPKEIDLRVRPADSDWDEVAEFVATHAEALDLVRQAAARPGLGYIVGFVMDEADLALWPEMERYVHDRNVEMEMAKAGLMGLLLPHMAQLRKLGQLLALDAHRAVALGDGALAAADIEASLGLAEHVREAPFFINELSSLRVIGGALTTVGEILAEHPGIFTDSQLHALAHRLAAVHGGRIQLRLDGEKLGFQDFVQRLYTDDGQGDGHLTAQGLRSLAYFGWMESPSSDVPPSRVGPLAPALGLVLAGRREMTEEYMRWITRAEAEITKPLWQQDTATLDREFGRLKDSPVHAARYFPIALLMPALGMAGRSPQMVIQQRDAMLVAIGLELYRRRTGAWPETLEQLVPELLPAVPRDRWQQDTATLDREFGRLKDSPVHAARYFPIALLMPALGMAGRSPQMVIQQRDAMLVAIGLELYRRRTGAWPETLEQLVPELLPAVPRDRFDGRAMRYQLVDGEPLLYSIGADRDDDGGRPPLDRRGRLSPKLAALVVEDPAKAADGDWVLWPPVLAPVGGSGSPGRGGG